MGASIYIRWPGCSEEDEGGHPGFGQDDHGYATWITSVLEERNAREVLRELGADALLCVGLLGERESKLSYTTPTNLRNSAESLRRHLDRQEPRALRLAELYKHGPGEQSAAAELAYDLTDLEAIAGYATQRGASRVVLLIGW